jgi:hypothetical protein
MMKWERTGHAQLNSSIDCKATLKQFKEKEQSISTHGKEQRV